MRTQLSRGFRCARAALAVAVLLVASMASAQTIGGSIAGVVRDTSGAVMPGVTIEAASPALIEGVRSAVTDGQGQYRIPELRPGLYTVTFTLPGFSVVRREGLELTTGFTATVNADLRVGGLEETITVAGASPVVDIQNIRTQNVFSRELLDTLPVNRSVAGFATLTLGASLPPTSQNVGGNQSETSSGGSTFSIHGGRGDDQKLLLDGMMAADASFAAVTNKNVINTLAVQEMIFQTGGMSAESETGGVQINVVPKEGGNKFNFYFKAEGSNASMQTENLTDELVAKGLRIPPSVKQIYDMGGAVGGPISRDKIWFFLASRMWGSQNYSASNFFNKTQSQYLGSPNSGISAYTPDLERRAYTNGYLKDIFNIRITWKATEKAKLNFAQNFQRHCDCYRGVEGLLAPEAVAQRIYGPTGVSQVTWNYPASNRLLFEAGNTVSLYFAETGRAPGILETDLPVTEQNGWGAIPGGYRWGASESATTNYASKYKKSHQANQRFVASLITGSHTVKTGISTQIGHQFDRTESNYLKVPYGNGKAPISVRLSGGVPNRITEYTELQGPIDLDMNLGIFLQDQWTVKRLTLNGGLRYSYFAASVPEVKIGDLKDSMFTSQIQAPKTEHIPQWTNLDPKLGAAFDLFGNGKTALKTSVGRYVAFEGLVGLPRANGPTRRIAATATRTWTDSNGNYYPDCRLDNPLAQNLTASGGDNCGQISNLNLGKQVAAVTYADDILHNGRPRSWQGSASLQQELMPGMALNVGYFRTWYQKFQATTNRALTAGNFDSFCVTVPTDAALGETSGKQICGLFDVKPANFGTVDTLITQSSNFGEESEVYDGMDIGINSRFGRGGILQGGVSIGRTVTDNCDVLDGNPQIANNPYIVGGDRTEFCRAVNTNQKQFKMAGNYPMPFGIEASFTYQNNPGIAVSATRVYTRAEVLPSLGRNLNDANVTVNVMKPFSTFGDRIQQIDLRFAKSIPIGAGRRLRGNFDLYNFLNSSVVLTQNNTYPGAGARSTWQQPTQILGGRLMKVGVQVDF